MKLEQYIENLNNLVKEKPEALQYDVVYSRDDEGNGFQEICCKPTLGQFEDDDFSPEEHYEEEPEEYEDFEINAICIN